MALTDRLRNIISGLIAVVLLAAATTIGINFSFGAFDNGYQLTASFDAAGQGLIQNSDVKIRGVNIGRVQGIDLRDGRAFVTMFINDGRDIPLRTSTFTVRPKTLFGEKFIDVAPGADETDGPYFSHGDNVPTYFEEGVEPPEGVLLDDEGQALRTAGGFELERVLAEAFPLVQQIEPEDLFTVLNTLAVGGDGLGEAINRSLVNNDLVLQVQTRHDDDTRRFLEDLALLSGELANRADDLMAGARDLNLALPVLTENGDSLTVLLQQTERLSDDVADILLANQAFISVNYNEGQRVLDVVFERRSQLVPLVLGLRQYVQTLAQVGRIPVGDGTMMAAVHGFLGADTCGLLPCDPGLLALDTSSAPRSAAATTPGALGSLGATTSGVVSTGAEAVRDLVLGLLGGSAR